jgi:nucleosome binding factor SPN SPT16 subunit
MATIDAAQCAARMKRFLASWTDGGDTMWGGATAVMVGTGVNKEDDLRYLKSVALEVWLFGYELPDTLILFTKTEVHVVTSGKKGACCRVIALLSLRPTHLVHKVATPSLLSRPLSNV